MTKIVHAAAIILVDKDKRVLIAKRPSTAEIMPDFWEFPGGKMEEGETPEQCLNREVKEELGVDLGCHFPLTFISEKRDGYHVIVYLYVCRETKGIPSAQEGQEIKWVRPLDLKDYELLPANKPLVPMIRDFI